MIVVCFICEIACEMVQKLANDSIEDSKDCHFYSVLPSLSPPFESKHIDCHITILIPIKQIVINILLSSRQKKQNTFTTQFKVNRSNFHIQINGHVHIHILLYTHFAFSNIVFACMLYAE